MKILVCGGRDYRDGKMVKQVLEQYHDELHAGCIIHGCATGADSLADEWARIVGVHCVRVKALWRDFGRGAGPRRNRVMLLLKPDLVIAFPGGGGTANMISQARKAGIEVREV